MKSIEEMAQRYSEIMLVEYMRKLSSLPISEMIELQLEQDFQGFAKSAFNLAEVMQVEAEKRVSKKELESMLFYSDLHLEAAIEEINRLKAILKDVKLTAEWHIEDCACSHPMSKYQLGWFEAMNLIKEKLNA